MSTGTATEAAGHLRGLSTAARALSLLACLLLFAMMLVTFIDVVGRYVFLAPLPAAYEIVSLMMPALIFCALPLTMLREGHVTVDLLDAVTPPGLRRVQAALVNLFSAGALGLIAWRLAIRSRDQLAYDEVTDELYLELWPFSAAMAALCVVAALCALVVAWQAAAGRARP